MKKRGKSTKIHNARLVWGTCFVNPLLASVWGLLFL